MDQHRTAIVIDLLRLGAFLARQGDRLLRELDVGQQEFVVLHSISINEPVSHTQISSELLFEKSNVSKIVGRLLERGLVVVSPSETDRRLRLLHVSAKGRRKVEHGLAVFEEWNAGWSAALSESELAATSTTLKRLLSFC